MTVIRTYEELEQGTDEWLQARCGIITASVIGKLITPTLKVADNETSRGVTLTLAAERITGHVEYVHPTFDMQRGTDDEPFARDAYADKFGVDVEQVGFIVREEPNPEGGYSQVGYSPDGLVGDDGLIEIKSRKPREQLRAFLSGKVPAENMAQLQTGLWVTGRRWIDYVSYSQGMPLFVTRVTPDRQWEDVIAAAVVEFERKVGTIRLNYGATTDGMPIIERRPSIEEISF